MKWDKNFVRSKYGSSYLGQEFIYYPATSCKRLLVFFSSMGKDKYDRYSWFWNENENWSDTSYLFIKDDSFKYFLGDDERPLKDTFRKIIEFKIKDLEITKKQVITVGASMGGYAALFYASYMQLCGAIVANPQVNYKSSRRHEYDNWERSIRSVGSQWYDLDDYLHKKPIPQIFIEHGNYAADKAAVDDLIESLKNTVSNVTVSNRGWKGHSVDGLYKDAIEAVVEMFEKFRDLEERYDSIG